MKKKTETEWLQQIVDAFGIPTHIEIIRLQGHVPQKTLADLHAFGLVLNRATKALKKAAAKYAWHAAPVIEALREEIGVEPGAFTAALKADERRSISWRGEFEKITSKHIADALLAARPAKITYRVAVTKTKAAARARARRAA